MSSLFALWSAVSFAAEIPSGALADAWSRRRLYALGALLTAAGYALWMVWPAYPGFALGFVLWGVGGSLGSGTLEALVYDELAAEGRTADYARVTGRAGTVAILAMLAATLVAAPAWSVGGYPLVGGLSVAITVAGGLLALGLPDNPGATGDDDEPGYWRLLTDGVREALRHRRTAWAVLIAAAVPGFTALDEYLPLLSRDKGAPTGLVPLLFAATALAMAAGSAAAARVASTTRPDPSAPDTQPNHPEANPQANGPAPDTQPQASDPTPHTQPHTPAPNLQASGPSPDPRPGHPAANARASDFEPDAEANHLVPDTRLGGSSPETRADRPAPNTQAGRPALLRSPNPPKPTYPLMGAAVLIAGGALTPGIGGMVTVSAAFGLLQFAMVLAETRLQDTITGAARSTVLSVAGFGSEVLAVGLYALFALDRPLPFLFALAAAPLLLTALAARRG